MQACDPSAGEVVVHSETLRLADALRRFKADAAWGVCDTGRYRCAYYTWGQGPPLLFIPGMSDDARSFVPLASLLSADFRCVAYDLPAGGPDRARLHRYRHADLVADALALLHHVGAARSYVFGSSFGSTVALGLMHACPDRVPRGALQGGFARRPLRARERFLARLAGYMSGRHGALPFRARMLRRVHHSPFAGREPAVWDYLLTRWGLTRFRALSHRALMLHGLDLRPVLPRIRQPVLLLCGDADPLVGKACEDELLRGLPGAGRVELSGCGHNPIFSHPEVVAEVVRRFLTPPACRA
jgi:pimeloyl-ACP methyl ester carboxylesterase